MQARKLLALVAGIAAASAGVVSSMILGAVIGNQLPSGGAPGTNVGGGNMGQLTYGSFLGISVALGITVPYSLWQPRQRAWWRNLILYGALFLICGISGANFLNNDNLVPIIAQSLLNLLMAGLSCVAVLDIISIKAVSNEGLVVRSAAILLLSSLGMALPMLFTILWLCNRLGFGDAVDVTWLNTIASLSGVVISYLSYRQKQREA
jgi:hypothetical protein